MAWPILAAGIAATTSAISNWWSNRTNKALANQQNAYNMNMWQAMNDYNTPSNQLARLKQAGINPNFMGSSISAGNVASSPTPSNSGCQNSLTYMCEQ